MFRHETRLQGTLCTDCVDHIAIGLTVWPGALYIEISVAHSFATGQWNGYKHTFYHHRTQETVILLEHSRISKHQSS